MIDGKRVKLQIWDTSGQGRFCTIIRSYSRGAQGILLVYDITNKWSFEGMDRWVREVEEHAPGIPKVRRTMNVSESWNGNVTVPNSPVVRFWLATDSTSHLRDRWTRQRLRLTRTGITWASMR